MNLFWEFNSLEATSLKVHLVETKPLTAVYAETWSATYYIFLENVK